MKLQYLGDSKDSFKWDYHDYLANGLGYDLMLALMMTPDDKSRDGNTEPSRFPARNEILNFCVTLRKTMNIHQIEELPRETRSSYKVCLHRKADFFINRKRDVYFSDLNAHEGKPVLYFLDPDNGFEPERSCSRKHVSYLDIKQILEQLPDKSVISVFQHFRRIPFRDDFTTISKRLRGQVQECHLAGIYWHSLMFVTISQDGEVIEKLTRLNMDYKDEVSKRYLRGQKAHVKCKLAVI